jgi:UDP-N-acetylglucosamine:LPS N-acetylglucosamine transferase
MPPRCPMPVIDLLFIRAGDGHVATAKALHKELVKYDPSIEVRLVDLQDPSVLGGLDFIARHTGITGVDIYNLMLRHDLTILDPIYLGLSRFNIRLRYKQGLDILRHFWGKHKPDLVVSLVPLFNGLILQALEEVSPSTPSLTILTDLCDVSDCYWFDERTRRCLVPTERARLQALTKGLRPTQVRLSTGLVLRQEFYDLPPIDCDAERLGLGLESGTFTMLILFGGNGSSVMKTILRRLDRLGSPIQAICLCGKNEKLADEITKMKLDFKVCVVGYTEKVDLYMRLADVFIGKPGNISVSEAVHLGLPVITTKNSATLLQERYTGKWLDENAVDPPVPLRRHHGNAPATCKHCAG